jgi:dTDP-glucose 4,6-dehydratase/UDP-glucose 4-epimerase
VSSEIDLIEGDVCSPSTVKKAAEGCDSLIHLAYLNGTEFFYSKPELVLEIAVKGMINTLDAAVAHGIKQFVLASSSEVYQTPPEIPTPETVPLMVPDVHNPRFSYGGGKIISELLCINYGRKFFDRMLIFRPHNVYGPDMGGEHVIPQLMLKALAAAQKNPEHKVPFSIQGDGSQTRAFIYIDDFIDGLMLILKLGKHNEIYHIGTDEEVAILDLAGQIMKLVGREPHFVHEPLPQGSTPRRCPDIRKLRSLGFAPKIPLSKGLETTFGWYKGNEHLYSSQAKAD